MGGLALAAPASYLHLPKSDGAVGRPGTRVCGSGLAGSTRDAMATKGPTYLPLDADAAVCHLDHAHVVSSVTWRQEHGGPSWCLFHRKRLSPNTQLHPLLRDTASCRGSQDPTSLGRPLSGRALTDGARASPRVLLQQLHDAGLLRGRAAAAHHGWALAGQVHELMLIELEADLGDRAS